MPGYAWYQALASPTNWVIATIGLISVANFGGLLWYYCNGRIAAGREEMKTTVTVNNTTHQPTKEQTE